MIIICAIVGLAAAQRGHYAGINRPINGARYDTASSAQANTLTGQNQGFLDNRFSGGRVYPLAAPVYPVYQQPAPYGIGSGFGSPYQGFNGHFYQHPQFPFAPFGYNGRR